MYVLILPTTEYLNRPVPGCDFPALAGCAVSHGRLKCHMYENALIPVALVNKLVSPVGRAEFANSEGLRAKRAQLIRRSGGEARDYGFEGRVLTARQQASGVVHETRLAREQVLGVPLHGDPMSPHSRLGDGPRDVAPGERIEHRMPPGSVRKRMKNSGSAAGMRAGWSAALISLHLPSNRCRRQRCSRRGSGCRGSCCPGRFRPDSLGGSRRRCPRRTWPRSR